MKGSLQDTTQSSLWQSFIRLMQPTMTIWTLTETLLRGIATDVCKSKVLFIIRVMNLIFQSLSRESVSVDAILKHNPNLINASDLSEDNANKTAQSLRH